MMIVDNVKLHGLGVDFYFINYLKIKQKGRSMMDRSFEIFKKDFR